MPQCHSGLERPIHHHASMAGKGGRARAKGPRGVCYLVVVTKDPRWMQVVENPNTLDPKTLTIP